MSGDLTAFLLARIAEDEQVAREATPGTWRAVEMDPGRFLVQADATVPGGFPVHQPPCIASENSCGDLEPGDARHIARWDPSRVLVECEARRRIVQEHGNPSMGPYTDPKPWCRVCCDDGPDPDWRSPAAWPCGTLRILALPYAGHPDCRREWALDGAAQPL